MRIVFRLIYNPHDDVSKTLALLDDIEKSSLPIRTETEIISESDHAQKIKDELLKESILAKIQIRQTGSGILYPHLLVYRDDQLSTFYPRRRKGEADIGIDEFLETVLTQNRRDDLVVSFYTTGRDCIDSAKFLYHKKEDSGRYEILLTQGIESLLTSFILFKELEDPLKVIETVKRYRHEYKKFYDHCRRLDVEKVLLDPDLEYIIDDLSASFFSSTIEARYPKVGLFRFMPSYFPLLEEKLIKPIGRQIGLAVDSESF